MKKLLFALLLLTGCGFTPLYSQNNTSLQDVQIAVKPIPNQYGFQMRRIIQNNLQTQTKSPAHEYYLTVGPPSFSTGDKTITSNELASTMQITGRTNYQLQDSKDRKNIYLGNVIAVSSYSVVKDPYATTVAKNHIQEELTKQLAEQIALDVMAQLSEEQK